MDLTNPSQVQWDIIGLGCTTIDDFLYVSQFPKADSKTRIIRSARQGGGQTRTALIAATRLGARCAFAGRLGRDEDSRFTIADFQKEGVDVSQVVPSEEACPIHAHIIVDTSNNTRTIFYAVNGKVGPDDQLPDANILKATHVLFIDQYGMQGNLRAVKIARDASISVVADFENDDSELFSEVLSLVDHLILPKYLAIKLTNTSQPEDCAKQLRNANRAAVIITEGANGCWVADRNEVQHYPAFSVDAVNTTGCGDVFSWCVRFCSCAGHTVIRTCQNCFCSSCAYGKRRQPA